MNGNRPADRYARTLAAVNLAAFAVAVAAGIAAALEVVEWRTAAYIVTAVLVVIVGCLGWAFVLAERDSDGGRMQPEGVPSSNGQAPAKERTRT